MKNWNQQRKEKYSITDWLPLFTLFPVHKNVENMFVFNAVIT